jgi:cbb3-type cytochrome oxidase subunit 3
MTELTYEAVAQFAQQAGTLFVGVAYALWPRNAEGFRRAAQTPLHSDEDEHVR